MFKPRRIESDIAPRKFIDLGNGNWYYNYDIKSEEVTIAPMGEDDSEKIETRYTYIQVKITGRPDYKRCVQLVIREYLTQNQEFDLINSYNRAAFNLLSDEETEKAGTEYIDYLQKVTEIKNKVKEDFDKHNLST